MGVMCMGL